MEKFLVKLSNIFLIDPDKVPTNKNANETEQMEVKRLFFYPSLTDPSDKRNRIGIVEGYLLFFNSFQSESEKEINTPQIFMMQNQLIISKKVDTTLILGMILEHAIDSENFRENELLDLGIFQRLFNFFIDLYCFFFGTFKQYQ